MSIFSKKSLTTRPPNQNPESELLPLLLELHHIESDKKQSVITQLTQLSRNIPYLQGYPQNPASFWNAESFMWTYKIEKETRKKITEFLQTHLPKNITPLDLGCGAYSYIPSIGFDISPKMLDLNDNLKQKMAGNIETPLPFSSKSQQAITAIFLLNYVQNISSLFKELHRILQPNGTFIAILSAKPVNDYHQLQQKQTFTQTQWYIQLSQYFHTTIHHQNDLLIFTCNKTKPTKTL